jgi:hypothetical protein
MAVIQKDDKFGHWQVLNVPQKGQAIQCFCTACNKIQKEVLKYFLTSGKSKSCGCISQETRRATNLVRYGTSSKSIRLWQNKI